MRDAGKIAGFCLLCFIWGSTWLAIKVGYGGLGPFTVAALRFAIAALILSAIVPMVGARWPRGRSEWTLVLVVGLLLFGGDYGLIYWAEQYIDSGLTAILFGTFPLMTMLAAHFYVPGEQFTAKKTAGGLLAFAGVVTLFGDRLNVNAKAALPMVAVIGAVICAAVSNVALKRHGQHIHSASQNAATTIVGTIVLFLLALIAGEPLRLPPDLASWAAVGYLSIVGSVVAFLIYFSLLKTWDATTVSFFAVFTPIVAIVLGSVFLHERLSSWGVGGSALIVIGVALTLVRAKPSGRPRAAGSGV
jgi:drug/metabolite transporter (DMT)-like permease